MIKTASHIFFAILGLLFLTGCLFIFLTFKKPREPRTLFKSALLIIFFTPFVFYLAVGIFIPKLGNPRNFFYLLPIYLLVIFAGLKNLILNRKIFYSLSVVILFFTLFFGIIPSYGIWKKNYIERALMRQAAKIDADFVVIIYTRRTNWPFKYYSRRYVFSHKIFSWNSVEDKEGLFRFFEEVKNFSKFAIIGYPPLHLQDKYVFGGKTFKINKSILQEDNYGPFWFLQKFIDRPPATITTYIFDES